MGWAGLVAHMGGKRMHVRARWGCLKAKIHLEHLGVYGRKQLNKMARTGFV